MQEFENYNYHQNQMCFLKYQFILLLFKKIIFLGYN